MLIIHSYLKVYLRDEPFFVIIYFLPTLHTRNLASFFMVKPISKLSFSERSTLLSINFILYGEPTTKC